MVFYNNWVDLHLYVLDEEFANILFEVENSEQLEISFSDVDLQALDDMNEVSKQFEIL